MRFWRTYNGQVFDVGEVDQLGFNIDDPSYIPDDYLTLQNFIILRTCFAIGDWGIISALPRKLKEKYPNAKIWIPSPELLRSMFGSLERNWSSWEDPFQVVHTIFDNNPYIDGFIDSFNDEVFNDHYRIYDLTNINEPLMKQILRFWQIDDFTDIEPELYFSESEKLFGDSIIYRHCDGKFGTLLISNRYNDESDVLSRIQEKLNEYNLPMFYWLPRPDITLTFKHALDMRYINTRIQLYIKTKAVYNIGNQTGMNDTIANYSTTYSVPRGELKSNFIQSQIYI
jgi:hypothetical protein